MSKTSRDISQSIYGSQDACQQHIQDSQLSEDELQYIGVKFGDYGVSTSSICNHFQVTLDTNSLTTCPITHCDEICQLLRDWKAKNPENATKKQMYMIVLKLKNQDLTREIEKFFGADHGSVTLDRKSWSGWVYMGH